jgi:hypothetical protein
MSRERIIENATSTWHHLFPCKLLSSSVVAKNGSASSSSTVGMSVVGGEKRVGERSEVTSKNATNDATRYYPMIRKINARKMNVE